MREFSEDPTAIPLVLMYKGEVLVSNDNHPISPGMATVLQDFDDVFPAEVPAGLPPLRGIEHQLILYQVQLFLTGHHTGQTPKRRRKFSNKYKRFWIKGIFVSALALVMFLLFWFLRKMVHGVCV